MACPTPLLDCKCPLHHVWSEGKVVIYPRSKLVAWHHILVRYTLPTNKIFGAHKLEHEPDIRIWFERDWRGRESFYLILDGEGMFHDDGDWSNAQNDGILNPHTQSIMRVYGVGLACVRTLQRWFRRVLVPRRQERMLAVMMATHKRAGRESWLCALDEALLQQLSGFM